MGSSTEKLVRDRIPEIVANREPAQQFRVADPSEMPGLLRAKLLEEVAEFSAATDGPAMIEELADVLEVIRALGHLCGSDLNALEAVRARKAAERGGFDAGIVLA
jgi:predicted house-cleaning noncanonical NTP pyrophosphatase (MazG superfamily)